MCIKSIGNNDEEIVRACGERTVRKGSSKEVSELKKTLSSWPERYNVEVR